MNPVPTLGTISLQAQGSVEFALAVLFLVMMVMVIGGIGYICYLIVEELCLLADSLKRKRDRRLPEPSVRTHLRANRFR